MTDTNILKTQLTNIFRKTQESLSTIRTGRVSSALIENIIVTTYNGEARLKIIELSTITNESSSTLLVSPFDPSVTADLETALRNSSLGFEVSVSGNQIRVKTPPLTEEQRQKYLKLVSSFTEEGREAIRRERDNIRRKLKEEFDTKTISEDVKFRMEEEIDKISREYTDKLEELKKRKEQEVMTI